MRRANTAPAQAKANTVALMAKRGGEKGSARNSSALTVSSTGATRVSPRAKMPGL